MVTIQTMNKLPNGSIAAGAICDISTMDTIIRWALRPRKGQGSSLDRTWRICGECESVNLALPFAGRQGEHWSLPRPPTCPDYKRVEMDSSTRSDPRLRGIPAQVQLISTRLDRSTRSSTWRVQTWVNAAGPNGASRSCARVASRRRVYWPRARRAWRPHRACS